jgi:hypothetical protein
MDLFHDTVNKPSYSKKVSHGLFENSCKNYVNLSETQRARFQESVPWFMRSMSAFHSSFSLWCRTERSSYPIHSFVPMRKNQKQCTFPHCSIFGVGALRRSVVTKAMTAAGPSPWTMPSSVAPGASQVRTIYSAHRRSYILFPASPPVPRLASAASASRISFFFSQGQSGGIRSWRRYRHLSTSRDAALRRVADRL